ncbi:MAG: ArsR/SmtB family transcription factor [Candidatus Baldrarchaeia archaeon]
MADELRRRISILEKRLKELEKFFLKLGIYGPTEIGRRILREPTSEARDRPVKIRIVEDVKEAVREKMLEFMGIPEEHRKVIESMDPEVVEKDLKALASRERLEILKLLANGGLYFGELMELTGLNPSPLSFHLSKLAEAGFIKQERSRGRYIITSKGMIALALLAFLYKTSPEEVGTQDVEQ